MTGFTFGRCRLQGGVYKPPAVLLERIRALETGAADDPGLAKSCKNSPRHWRRSAANMSILSAKIGQGTGGCHCGAAGAAPGGGGLLRPMVAAEGRDRGLHGQNTPPRQPLTQRKEFRSLKNWIIREAEDISFSPSADSTEPEEKQSAEKTPPIRGSVDVQPVGEAEVSQGIFRQMRSCGCCIIWGRYLGRVCRSSHLRCESTPSAADGCRRSAWPWDTSEMTTRTSSSAMSTKTPCNRRYNAWVNLYISHPQKNGRPTRLTCHLFCVTEAKSSCRLDGSTGWPATTASLYAPMVGMIMLRGGGGTAISFVRQFYTTRPSRKPCPYCWVETDRGIIPIAKRTPDQNPPSKPYLTMRRMYAYLTKHRCIDRDVVTAFVQEKLLYEDDPHHNCVFVGLDENGEARHAHLRSTSSQGKVFRINVESSDIKHSFHKNGTDRSLYVFEAPIDLLSHITLYPAGWLEHSYVACCGTSIQPVLERLRQNPKLDTVYLCLDNDEAGEDACDGMLDTLEDMGYDVERLRPEGKDWNDDLRAKQGWPWVIYGSSLQRAASWRRS